MPSKRPTSHPSKKPSSSADPDPEKPDRPISSPDKNPNPSKNPNPKSSKKPKPSHPMPKDPAASPRKSNGKRQTREVPDKEVPADSPGAGKGSQSSLRRWTEDDNLAVLRGVVEFRSRTGKTPTGSTLGAFFESIKESLPPQFTQDQVYNKLRHLRHKYHQAVESGSQDIPSYKLLLEAWGTEGKKASGGASEENGDVVMKDKVESGEEEEDNEEEEEEEDDDEEEEEEEDGERAALYPFLASEMAEYFKKNGLLKEMLESVLKVSDPEEAKALDDKFRQHYEAELKLQAERYDLAKEVATVLGEAFRGRSS